jgi:hypothetical protein
MTLPDESAASLPPHAFIPGGPWRHPTASSAEASAAPPIAADDWSHSEAYLRGIQLFNAGYYWEAHECWEALWHAHGRHGPTADLLKGLIKLAAAGVKVRQRQRHGVVTHAARAAACLAAARRQGGRLRLGLDLDEWIENARAIATAPPEDLAPPGERVSRVFAVQIEPRPRRA